MAVKLAVGLGTRSAHGGAFGAVQDSELDSGVVGNVCHKSVEGIDLAHEMAFAEPAYCGIAGHGSDGGEGKGDEGGLGAEPRRGGGGLASGVASSNHDYIHVSRHAEKIIY